MAKRGGYDWITPAEFQELAKAGKTPPAIRGMALRKEFLPEIKAIDDTARTVQFRITTGARDRDHDTISPTGWEVADYLKNPVVLFAHDYSSLPIAKALSITADVNGLVALDEFTPADMNPFGDCVYRMVKAGYLNATSVGFRPLEWVYNEEAHGVDFSKQALLEHSVVPVPANAEALVEARSAGIDLTPLMAWAEEKLDTWKKEDGLYVPKGQVEAVFRILSTKTVNIPEPTEAKPYPNEHACRLRNPDDFQANSFRRMTREHEGKQYSVIMGRLQGEDTMTEQAYRYAKDSWSASEARSHCQSHNGSFEAASGETGICASCQEEIDKGFAPAALPIQGTYQWITQQLSTSSEEYMRRMSSVRIRQQDWTMVAATWPEKALIAVVGPDRPWDEDLAYQVAWSMREGIPAWTGEPQEIDMQVQVELRPIMRTMKRGRVLSSVNEQKLRQAMQSHMSGVDMMKEVLAQVEQTPEQDGLEIIEHRSADPVLEIEVPAKGGVQIEVAEEEPHTVNVSQDTLDQVAGNIARQVMDSLGLKIEARVTAAVNRARGRID